jgi:GT2 family glycosyltransferase
VTAPSLPVLSVVIPSNRRADLLRDCLASLQAHASAGTEIIVVDDGSPAAAVSRAATDFPGVTVLRHDRPTGFCAAANRGVAAARAPVVELLNDDTRVTPGWAEPALSHFADPAVAAVAPLLLTGPTEPGEPPRVDSAGDDFDVGGFARKRGRGERLAGRYLRGGPVFGACAAAAFYRRELLLQVGGFPEEFGAYFDDVDLSFRLHQAGGSVIYEPASVVWHRGSASYGRTPSRRVLERQSCNEELVFWRNLPAPLLWRALPRHLAVLGAKALRRLREGTLPPWLFGRLRAWAGWRALLRHRRSRLAGWAGRDLSGWCLGAGPPHHPRPGR